VLFFNANLKTSTELPAEPTGRGYEAAANAIDDRKLIEFMRLPFYQMDFPPLDIYWISSEVLADLGN
jgi:hypothetical protein